MVVRLSVTQDSVRMDRAGSTSEGFGIAIGRLKKPAPLMRPYSDQPPPFIIQPISSLISPGLRAAEVTAVTTINRGIVYGAAAGADVLQRTLLMTLRRSRSRTASVFNDRLFERLPPGPDLMVLLETGGVEQSQLFCQYLAEVRGFGNLNGRFRGVRVNRGRVKSEIGRNFLQVEAAYAAYSFIGHDGRH